MLDLFVAVVSIHFAACLLGACVLVYGYLWWKVIEYFSQEG